jgi:hypothetical protein
MTEINQKSPCNSEIYSLPFFDYTMTLNFKLNRHLYVDCSGDC